MIRTLFAKVKAEAFFLVLLAVAAVGAWLYVQYRQVSADRDDLQHRAELICAGSGTDFTAIGKTARGVRCTQTVAGLVKFKADSDQLAARTLADALAEHDARQNDDTRAARAAAEAASSAAHRMEMADAQAERTNLVDHEWFRAVNGVAGLHAAR
ncbi:MULTISPECIES: hypothetical protein [unclassified Sphingomonas]|jgi:hypothetical protein|uniref:hypothetical protein n=1 Tax=unclassified Sphingomonas TaxID=196159 RepID=UPI0006F81869|nr:MULTISPECIES: hypothetical protein [unclassified Sphingomonas]KQN28300.1 hypothetical protein ASF00_10540 [Sphingomonas sp. Leaf34]KQN29713.1 hypothetical protein ASE88_12695 [Sphingomonas sp. Leaf38]